MGRWKLEVRQFHCESASLPSSIDDERRDEVLESWRRQMEGVMEFTADLVECVNTDTKEAMVEGIGRGGSSPMETSLTIEEKEERDEDEEKEEEIMKLFWTPTILPPGFHKGQVPSLKSQVSKQLDKIKKDNRGMRPLDCELDEAEKKQNNRNESHSQGYHIYKGLKMLTSTLDSEDIFDDWNWNFDETESPEAIFSDWFWNLDMAMEIRQLFYNDPMTENAWNDFHFWRPSPCLTDDTALELLAKDSSGSPDSGARSSPDSGCVSKIENEKEKLNNWLDWYWEDTYQNESILQSLLSDEIQDKDKTPPLLPVNFWDESANNEASNVLQMKYEEIKKDSQFLWEDKEIIFALVPKEPRPQHVQYFPWEDPDTMASLMEQERSSRRTSGDSTFLWDDPAAIGMLLTDEEDEAYLPWDDKTDMTEELPSTLEEADSSLVQRWQWERMEEEPPQHNTWEEWSLWDQFGTSRDILQAYDAVSPTIHRPSRRMKKVPQINIEEAFWDITMTSTTATRCLSEVTDNLPAWHAPDIYADAWDRDTPRPSSRTSGNLHKDPLNTFKAFRYIFNEGTRVTQQHTRKIKENKPLLDDMLDIYAEWAPNVLADERIEKKWQRRGRGRARGHRPSAPVPAPPQQAAPVRRPGTPTVSVSKVKMWNMEGGWIESRLPKKGRKMAHGWRTGRSQRQLHAKINAKQPRSNNAVFNS